MTSVKVPSNSTNAQVIRIGDTCYYYSHTESAIQTNAGPDEEFNECEACNTPDCNSCLSGTDCNAGCPLNCTPDTIYIVLSGMNAQTCGESCTNCGAGNSMENVSATVDGQYQLTQSSACIWTGSGGNVNWDYYASSSTCTGTPTNTDSTITIELEKLGDTTWQLTIYTGTGSNEIILFTGFSFVANDADRCIPNVVQFNTNALTCQCSSAQLTRPGGSATIKACFTQ